MFISLCERTGFSEDICSKQEVEEEEHEEAPGSNPAAPSGGFDSRSFRMSFSRVSLDHLGLRRPEEDDGESRSEESSKEDSYMDSGGEWLPWLSPVDSIVSQRPTTRMASLIPPSLRPLFSGGRRS